MTSDLIDDLEPGKILADKFRIERVLGRGGMGVVVAAKHLRLDEHVAIKFLLPEALDNSEAVARFEREARAAAKIRSEHVARVSDVGRLDSGAPYMVMEHLTGMDLKEYLTSTGPLPVEETVHYLMQASEALAEAHALGIVHRDLKPANMFRIIRSDGSPSIKLLDFGISKLQNTDVSMTRTSMMMGSPYYMSPEQMTSAKDVDARTDIWALGVIVYQLLTGRVPYEGETIAEVCSRVMSHIPPRLSESRSDIPRGLQEVLDRALEKNRDQRYSDVAEFSHALSPFGQPEDEASADRISRVLGVVPTIASPDPSLDPTIQAPSSALTPQHQERPSPEGTLEGAAHTQMDYRPPTSSGGRTMGVGLAILALAGGGLYLAASSADRSDVEAITSPTEDAEKDPESGGQQVAETTPVAEPPREKQALAKEEPEPSAAPRLPTSVKPPSPPPERSSRPAPVAAAQPAPPVEAAPAPEPEPEPAPEQAVPVEAAPAPAPADPSSFYLDRQ